MHSLMLDRVQFDAFILCLYSNTKGSFVLLLVNVTAFIPEVLSKVHHFHRELHRKKKLFFFK